MRLGFFFNLAYLLDFFQEFKKTWNPTLVEKDFFHFFINNSFGDIFNPFSAKLRKWPNTLKQFVGNLPTNSLSVFGHFVGLALKGLILLDPCFLCILWPGSC